MDQVNKADGALSSTLRVVVAEDHQLVRETIMMVLEEYPDLEVVGSCSSGLDAIKMAREMKPDVILMDIAMPGMDGITATRIIHAFMPEVRIIIVTTHIDPAMRGRAFAAGAAEFVCKPCQGSRLVAIIRGEQIDQSENDWVAI